MKKENPVDFFLPQDKSEKGGKGSGNWGHGGLPGVHGGSSSSSTPYHGKLLSKEEADLAFTEYLSSRDDSFDIDAENAPANRIADALMFKSESGSGDAEVMVFFDRGGGDKSEDIVAAISYGKAPHYDEHLYIYYMGATERGAGLKCLEHVFSVAESKGFGVMGDSSHAGKITEAFAKRYGVYSDAHSGGKYAQVIVGAEHVSRLLKIIKKWSP